MQQRLSLLSCHFLRLVPLQARQAFGRWLNCVRNAQRMLLSWAPPDEAHIVHEFARWNAALTTAACAYLRREDAYWQHAEDLLQPGELLWLTRCDNPPVKVTMVMSGLLKRWVAWAGVVGSEGLSKGFGCAVTGQRATVPAALPYCTVHCPLSRWLPHSLAACKLVLCFAFVLTAALGLTTSPVVPQDQPGGVGASRD